MRAGDAAGEVVSRRGFLRRSASVGSLLLPSMVAGRRALASPAEASAASGPLRFLSADEAADLERLGEALVPGSAAAGLVHYVDHQLAAPAADSMLMARYLGVVPPFGAFYRAALAAVHEAFASGTGDATARAHDLGAALQRAFTGAPLPAWSGPPAGLVYFVLRSDAIDVLYGTPAGFARLGVPYMAHIQPPSRWGE